MAGLIDPTTAGKYPVILGDGLLGKTSNEIFTRIQYNHKPALPSDDASNHARLKPSLPGKTDSYDLSFAHEDGTYAYAGSRNTSSSQYVLHFDTERKAFILDRIDSTFNMNITRLPGNSDAARLSRQYPHLDSKHETEAQTQRAGAKKTTASKDTLKTPAAKAQSKEPKRKTEKKQQAKEVALSFPEPQKEKLKPKRKSFDEEEDEDEDDDGGLLIEYPGADTAARQTDFSPAFPPPRRFDDFMDQRDSEAEDADGESDDEPDMDFKLPSPVNHHRPEPMQEDPVEEEHDQGEGAGDLEDDLEKELEEAFEDLANSQGETPVAGDESEISEED
ncbi:Transcription elognation factor Eaf [Metarhizium rileyi]|uniref:Transcription elognation factor Eaf n=1 Tax=Metarhizium rileyi (strain RCEF 4871) TaxID=1649241 RepID=A0A162HSS0_METRR|nr:Transcription elognation factor Eaf [Metarhizium rileyi RCEF 4871]TWU76997.1 hypothetical protein ED733_007514 [Metarhizium rileyi]